MIKKILKKYMYTLIGFIVGLGVSILNSFFLLFGFFSISKITNYPIERFLRSQAGDYGFSFGIAEPENIVFALLIYPVFFGLIGLIVDLVRMKKDRLED